MATSSLSCREELLGDPDFIRLQSVEVENSPQVNGETRPRRNTKFPNLLDSPDGKCFTLYDVYQRNKDSDSNYLGVRELLADGKTRGEYKWISYRQGVIRANHIGSALVYLGLKKGDRIGIFSINRPEWVLSDMAAMNHSLVPVALYATLGANAIEYVVNHSEISVLLCEGKNVEKILSMGGDVIKTIVSYDPIPQSTFDKFKDSPVKLYTLAEFEKIGQDNPAPHEVPSPSDLCTLLYTSGSTGNPKGVMLSHVNMVSEVAAANNSPAGVIPEDVHMSYLPLAHSFERAVVSLMCYVGGQIGFFSGLIPELFNDIQVLRPTFLCGAPRVWQRLHDKLWFTVNNDSWLKKFLFNWGLNSKQAALKAGSSTPIWDKLIFQKTKDRLGGRVKFILSGSAPLDPKLAEFLRACFCCPVVSGYGLSENVGGASVAYPEDGNVGHVGPPLSACEMKLVDVPEMNYFSTDKPFPRGEVCIRGHNVFKGYFKDPAKTAEDLKEDGWFHTGDVGRWNANGTLSIIDRKKNIFKLSQGEYVAAEYLESVFTRSPFASQVFVYGDSLNSFLVGVVVPDFEVVQKLFATKYPNIDCTNTATLVKSPELYKEILSSFDACAAEAKLHGFEKLKHIHVEHEAFTEENDLLTPSFKPKRPQLKIRYQQIIDNLYAEYKRDHPDV